MIIQILHSNPIHGASLFPSSEPFYNKYHIHITAHQYASSQRTYYVKPILITIRSRHVQLYYTSEKVLFMHQGGDDTHFGDTVLGHK